MPILDKLRCPLCHGVGFKPAKVKEPFLSNSWEAVRANAAARLSQKTISKTIVCKHCGAKPTEDWAAYEEGDIEGGVNESKRG